MPMVLNYPCHQCNQWFQFWHCFGSGYAGLGENDNCPRYSEVNSELFFIQDSDLRHHRSRRRPRPRNDPIEDDDEDEYDEFVSLLFHLAALRQWPN